MSVRKRTNKELFSHHSNYDLPTGLALLSPGISVNPGFPFLRSVRHPTDGAIVLLQTGRKTTPPVAYVLHEVADQVSVALENQTSKLRINHTLYRSLVYLLLGCAMLPAAVAAQGPATSEAAKPTISTVMDGDLAAREHARAAREDARIAAQIAARLALQDGLRDVTGAVTGGVVILSGTVLDNADRELAESIAATIEGVIAVQQRIAINANLRERASPALAHAQKKLLRLVAALPLLLVASGVVLVFVLFGRWLARRLHLLRWGSNNPYLDSLLRRGVHLMTLLIGVLIALDLLGATALVGAVLGSAGVLGIMLGFAFRDIAENYLAGVLLSLRRPFEPDDLIMINGHEGKVISLNSRATILMTLDGNHLRLPNAMVFKGVLLNYTRNPMRRLKFTLGIGTGEDLNTVRRLGVETLRNIAAIASEPEPQVMIQSVGDSSVLVDFFAWLDQREVDFLKTRSEAIRQVKRAIETEGMDMPEPIYRVQLIGAAGHSEAVGKGITTAPRVPKPPLSDGVETDVSVNHDLDVQVALERANQEGEDLLQHPAPME